MIYDTDYFSRLNIYLQPQFNHMTGAMIGAEVLARLKEGDSYIQAGEFIGELEQSGRIYETDKYIWEQVCIILRGWIEKGKKVLPVSLNISRQYITNDYFINDLLEIMGKYNITPDFLRLEITEKSFSESPQELIKVIKRLAERGFIIEIDGFGSGHSSLNLLKDVPVSILKLDIGAFFDTDNVVRSGNIIESIIRMARWLDMAVIAVCVEKKEQADFLSSIGCYYVQGYLFAKPMTVEEYEGLMNEKTPEKKLTRLKTITTLNNNEFWNPESMETLIFNSYVGGACILEYCNDTLDLLRVNVQYLCELGSITGDSISLPSLSPVTYLDEKNLNVLMTAIRESITTKRETACELVVDSRDGSTEYIEFKLRIIAKADTRYLIYCVVTNTTERRMTEQKLLHARQKEMESAQQLQVIMNNINGGVSAIIISDDGKSEFVFNNNRYYSLYGYTREEALSEDLDVLTLILPEDFEEVMSKIRRLKEDRIPTVIDYRCRKKSGEIVYLRANSSLIDMEGYGSSIIASVLTDITEQKLMENQLKEAELKERLISDKLQTVMNHAGNGITAVIMHEDRNEFVFANDKYYEILGYTREEYVKHEFDSVYEFIHPDDRERVKREVIWARRNYRDASVEYRVIKDDKKLVWIKTNITIIHLYGIDDPVQICVFMDITKEKEANDQLSFLNDSAHDILEQPDIEKAMNVSLRKILDFFDADRAYVIEIDSVRRNCRNTYEVCREGVSQEKENLQNVPVRGNEFWYVKLLNEKYVYIEDVNKLEDKWKETRDLLLAQHIHSLIFTALNREGKLIGFVGVDNPARSVEQLGRMMALGDYLAVLLTKRDLDHTIQQDDNTIRLLMDDTPGGFCKMHIHPGKAAEIEYVNDGFRSMLMMSSEEIKRLHGMDAYKFLYQDDIKLVQETAGKVLSDGGQFSTKCRIVRKDGSCIWIMIFGRFSVNRTGDIYMNAYFADMSNHTASYQEMLPVALSTMMTASDEMAYIKDSELKYICCSHSAASAIGISNADDIIGKTDHDLFNKKLADKFNSDDRKIMNSGKSIIGTIERIPAEEGKIRLVRTSKYPVMDSSGEVIGLYGTSRDVTEINEKESLLSLLTNSIPGGLAAFSLTNDKIKTLFFNEGFCRYSGYSHEEYMELTNEDPFKLVFDEDRGMIYEIINRHREYSPDDCIDSCVLRYHKKGGDFGWMSMRCRFVRVGDDQWVMNVVQLDITEQRRIEENLRNLKKTQTEINKP